MRKLLRLTAIGLVFGACSTRAGAPTDAAADVATEVADTSTDEMSDPLADEDTADADGPKCVLNQMRSCYEGDPAHEDVGECDRGIQQCAVDEGEPAWTECLGWVEASEETCGNDLDEDCDGAIDEEPDGSACARDNSDCWITDSEICSQGGCGNGYEEAGPCWAGGCLDPPAGNCCSYHYRTTDRRPNGALHEAGVHYCE